MQRRALVQAVTTAAVLAVALAGCTGSDESTGAVDSLTGGAGASSATVPSGKYSSLPEPCTALSTGTLADLLPGADEETEDATEDAAEEALAGEPDLTYDADRQVGCRWERETTEGGHKLGLQFERIVSYDDEVSDDEQAAQIYAERAGEHDVDVSSDAPDLPDKGTTGDASGVAPATGGGSPDSGATDDPQPGESSAEAGGESAEETPNGSTDDATAGSTDGSADATDSPDAGSGPAETIAPRLLDDIGDESFLDDETAGAGAGVQRAVTVVFRTSNVVVTVTYDQWHTAGSEPPDSAELQERAQQVADQLADQLAG
ncbi:hypothetical protein O7599_16090 [Streptomyces sp. WMMC500]|uniref:hypothetical protein n=1 Tax=Streptomyces sp. WMMC500 TaxID=3015154 RepID=UPI00248C9872|nr:hypothetical protein [Streptomyces sp. WMMC500]WBB63941.1 hypothetical protein O7599_16090 [Streptomyces sp. WMMC500]